MSDENAGMVDTVCPSCGQSISIHKESVAIGAEVLCHECGSLLGVEQRMPLRLVEVTADDI